MKRFRFGLEKVLKVKKLRERMAEAKLAQARLALDAARQHAETLAQEIARVAGVLEKTIGSVLPPESWGAAFEHSSQLARALREAEAALTLASAQFDEAANARRLLATEVEALKSLRQQQWQEHREETQKSEQNRLDEMGMRRWSENS